jgi:AmmeMemoRadiSam system protein B
MRKTITVSVLLLPFLILISSNHPSPSYTYEKEGKAIRAPVAAGTFYPESPNQLRERINTLLNTAPEVKPAGQILAAIAPHAGYGFSGAVAAYTYRLLSRAEFDTVVIIGHDTYRDAVAFTCPVDYFQTPLGNVPVDREMMAKIGKSNPGIIPDYRLHAHEHSIEVQLPFLQVLGRPFKIVPILFGSPTVKNCRILSEAILSASTNKSVLILASTDMSHYPPYEWARKVDQSTLEVLKSLDVEKLFTYLEEEENRSIIPNLRTAMCAKGGVGTAILFAKALGANHTQILGYANSGDVPPGEKGRVVGYCAVLMVKSPAPTSR